MHISTLSLKNYRNIEKINLELGSGVNIFYGNNAQGKTNLLEAIYICSTGRSHRTHLDKDLINFNKDEAHIKIYFVEENVTDKLDIHLKRNLKKGIALNNMPIRKLGELFGIINIVIFSPEDLQLIKAGPSERRRFIDMEICKISNIYYYNLQEYYKILKQRNNLLKKIQKDSNLKESLFVWDEQLVNFGTKLIKIRANFINKINKISHNVHLNLTNNKENLNIEYKPSVSIENFDQKTKKNIEKDVFYGSTSFGPHKDDLNFYINNINAREFSSQGQQRTISLSLKLAEIELIKQEKKVNPILLLDDVLSELDKNRQKFLINFIKNIQVIITCTGVEDIIKNIAKEYNLYNVQNGKILKKVHKY